MAATKHGAASRRLDVANKDRLMAADEQRDIAQCGRSLAEPGKTRFAKLGAHDPTPTPYFILEDLFEGLRFEDDSHLLDVGCGTGRVLAYFLEAHLPGRATGIELDPEIAAFAASWTSSFEGVDVIEGNALEIPLAPYSHLYLFNPFDTNLLERFIMKIEQDAARETTVVHMSDNGETYSYIGRTGWSLVREGEFHSYRTASGRSFHVYDHPQHFSIWRYDPEA